MWKLVVEAARAERTSSLKMAKRLSKGPAYGHQQNSYADFKNSFPQCPYWISLTFANYSCSTPLQFPLSCHLYICLPHSAALLHGTSIGSASTQPAPEVWFTIQHCLASQKPVGTRPKAKQLYAENARTIFHSPGSCMSMVKVMQKIPSDFQKYLVSPIGKEKSFQQYLQDKLS